MDHCPRQWVATMPHYTSRHGCGCTRTVLKAGFWLDLRTLTREFAIGLRAGEGFLRTLLMGVHHFFWFFWEGVVVEPAGR